MSRGGHLRALQLVEPGRIEVRDVPVPDIGPAEVLVKVAGAGLCHSDLHMLHIPQPVFPPGMTLGHETAGYVAATGSQVTGLSEGDAVLVYLVWACGHCTPCVEGRDNVCTAAAPLADAGLTPMHAINGARHRLTPGATVLAGSPAAAEIFDLAGGYGVSAAFDFVGAQPTLDLAAQVIAPDGALRAIGIGGGTLPFGSHDLPWGVDLRRSYGGDRADQRQVIELARLGKITVQTRRYPLDEGVSAFSDLEAGKVMGRAVLVP